LKKNYDYNKEDIVNCLKKCNLSQGDSVFVHSNLGFFGKLENAENADKLCQIFEEAIFEVIGDQGTLIVPTYSLSFCNNEIYDLDKTPSYECGIFSEYIRKKEKSKRTDDGNFSVSAIGFKANFFTTEIDEHSFGENSFWGKFWKENGKICRFNMSSDYNTFIHFVEKKNNVQYRMDKIFSGIIINKGKKIRKKNIHFVRNLNDNETIPHLNKLDKILENKGLIFNNKLGKGEIIISSTKDIANIISEEIKKTPSFLIKGEIRK